MMFKLGSIAAYNERDNKIFSLPKGQGHKHLKSVLRFVTQNPLTCIDRCSSYLAQ